jgi:6-phosphogluconolactonase
MSVQRAIFPSASEAALACSARIHAILTAAIAQRPFASLAISGGSSPKPIFEDLSRKPLDWRKVHLFWVDERIVPPEDAQSNYGMARRMLSDPAGIPSENVHRVAGELPPGEAAQRYIEEISTVLQLNSHKLPEFDVIHCGIGADGHTARLVPGDRAIEDR